ncbi:hypothetical protein DFQ30_008189 [Apophysomyces sp. BC1015]|nr:hypothetical protein DFQ30_008189 [Apophysomyces sp. BC1015]
MVGISGVIGSVIGLPLGVLLHLSERGGMLQNVMLNRVLGMAINAVRSTPFIILLVAVIPFTRLVVGSSIGTAAAVVLLPEAWPGIVAALTLTFVSLVGYSAMAGAIGGGGLGDLGIRYGYQRFLPEVMLAVVLVLIVFVQLVQSFGDYLVRRLSHK